MNSSAEGSSVRTSTEELLSSLYVVRRVVIGSSGVELVDSMTTSSQ